MKVILIIWGLALVYCVMEAIFLTEIDPESKKELKSREKWQQEE